MEPQNKNKVLIKVLRFQYGNGAKNTDELEKLGKHYIGKKFLGAFAYDEYPLNAPNKTYAILNTDNKDGEHWVGIYKDKNNLHVYDSFGRHTNNILKKFTDKAEQLGYNIVDCDYDCEQGNYQNDCGLRSLAWLMITKKDGIKKSETI